MFEQLLELGDVCLDCRTVIGMWTENASLKNKKDAKSFLAFCIPKGPPLRLHVPTVTIG